MSNIVLSSDLAREKRIQLSLMLKKIAIRLSRDQFEVLEKLTIAWMSQAKSGTLEEKALYVMVFENLYRKKISTQLLTLKKRISLNLNLPDAFALSFMLGDLYLSDYPYEQSLSDMIMSEIDRQTA